MTQDVLVFGAAGQIGSGVLPRLRAQGLRVRAITRAAIAHGGDSDGVSWQQHDLFGDGAPPVASDTVLSLGPLDGFVRWLERVPAAPSRIVAFGSTSVRTKRDSIDPRERAVAQHLQRLETRLENLCAQRDIAWALLRPTLIYGVGRDATLTRIAALARRWGIFALPAGAHGRRQPVHADDLAHAAFQVAFLSAGAIGAYDLPGGETLRYDEMVRRTLACLRPPKRLVTLPAAAVTLALAMARSIGRLGDAGPGVLQRLRQDLVFDDSRARRDFGWNPRPFRPEPGMFDRGA